MNKLSPEAIELLNKIVAFAEQEPRRFNMNTWYKDVSQVVRGNEDVDDANADETTPLFEDESDVPPCGAVGCLAGIACIVSGRAAVSNTETIGDFVVNSYDEPRGGWFAAAQEVLGLTVEQAETLFIPHDKFASNFYSHHWSEPFASEYKENANNPEARFRIMKRYVAHFIATNGAE